MFQLNGKAGCSEKEGENTSRKPRPLRNIDNNGNVNTDPNRPEIDEFSYFLQTN
mgnify:CR=1 FL=1